MADMCVEDQTNQESTCFPDAAPVSSPDDQAAAEPERPTDPFEKFGHPGIPQAEAMAHMYKGVYDHCVPEIVANGGTVQVRGQPDLKPGESIGLTAGVQIHSSRSNNDAQVVGCDGSISDLGDNTLMAGMGRHSRLDEVKKTAADTTLITPDQRKFLDTLAGRKPQAAP